MVESSPGFDSLFLADIEEKGRFLPGISRILVIFYFIGFQPLLSESVGA